MGKIGFDRRIPIKEENMKKGEKDGSRETKR
jgi:hypothetical protein